MTVKEQESVVNESVAIQKVLETENFYGKSGIF